MKIFIPYRLVRYIATYHVLSTLIVSLVLELDGASGRPDLKTKLLLQNIRTRLAQKADEIIKNKECESGLILCKNLKSKESEGDDDKSEESPPPPKAARGQHKPTIRINPKDVTQTLMPKVHKSLFRKSHKFGERDEQKKTSLDSQEESDEDEKKDDLEETTKDKIELRDLKKPVTFIKESLQNDEKTRRSSDDKQKKVKDMEQGDKKITKKLVSEIPTNATSVRKEFPKDTSINKIKEGSIEAAKIEKLKKLPTTREDKKRELQEDVAKVDKVRKVAKDIIKTDKVKDASKTPPKSDKEISKNATKTDKIIKKEKKIEKKDEKKRQSVVKPTAEESSVFLPGNSFIFVLDSENVENKLCQRHSKIYLKQLKKYQIWALMMYDASAKFPSGVLQGNVNQYGDFDECLAINAVFKNLKEKSKKGSGIKGKYCLATVDVTTDSDSKNLQVAVERTESFQFIKSTIRDPGHFIPRFSTINWGMCVPSACHAEDVEAFLKSRLESFANSTGLQFHVDVDDTNCVVKDNLKFELETETIMVIMFYLVILSVSLYATILDVKKQREINEQEREFQETPENTTAQQENQTRQVPPRAAKFSLFEKAKQILMAFSLKRNLEKLLTDNNKGAIECINGIKSIFTVMLYFAHKTIPLGMTPFSNRIFLTKISNQPVTILLRASIIYTDSFLLISGVLTSYNLAKEISEKRHISWIKKAVARFIRLTPALFAVILFYSYVWDRLGSGPVWNLLIKKNSSLCRKYMWRNMLYIQNLFAFENMCAPQTHQLALDMQLSLLAPFFVHLMHTYDKAGVGILQAFFILSSIMRYITASNNQLSVVIYHGMSVSQLYETANMLYGQTFHRASPYILGTIVGYHLKKFEKHFEIPKAFAALGWILSFTFGFYSVVSPSPLALRGYQYDVQDAAQYAALSPVAWSLALSWVIVACHLGYGGFLNEFLCRKIFLVLSRISYAVYLTQFLVFFYNIGITRIPEMFTFTGSINVTEFLTVIAISVIVTVLFDIPMMEVKKIILDKAAKKVSPEDDVQSDHEEQSIEVSEIGSDGISREDSQESTDDILEPIEDEGEDCGYDGEEPEEVNIDDKEDEPEEGIEEHVDEESEVEEESDGNADEEVDKEDVEEAEDEAVEVFEIRPLRRSTKMHFSDESEDANVYKVDPDLEEDDEK